MTGKMDWLFKEQQRVLQLQLPRSHGGAYTCWRICASRIHPCVSHNWATVWKVSEGNKTSYKHNRHLSFLFWLIAVCPRAPGRSIVTPTPPRALSHRRVANNHGGFVELTGLQQACRNRLNSWLMDISILFWLTNMINCQVFSWKYPENISHTVNTAIIVATKGSLKIGRCKHIKHLLFGWINMKLSNLEEL